MKPLQVAQDILPLAQLKAHTSQVFRQLQREQRPLVITQNGRPAAVLLTPAEFDRLSYREHVLAKVNAGLVDSLAGRLIDDEDLSLDQMEEPVP